MANYKRSNTPIAAGDSTSHDAFGRWRVSDPYTLFDSSATYEDPTMWWEDVVVGGGDTTHTPASADITLTTGGGTSGDGVKRQTRSYFHYQPGKSQLIYITGTFGAQKANVYKRYGYFDDSNGIFFEQRGSSGMQIVRRSKATGSVVDTRVAQADWNWDPMNGTGPSGKTFDPEKSIIMFIDFEWLGVGRVRVGFIIDGAYHVCHTFNNTQSLTGVYMSTPHLPVRAEITNAAAAAGATTMTLVCASVMSEGGRQDTGLTFGVGRTSALTVGARRAVLSIRPAATYNTITNRMHIQLDNVELTNASNPILWELVYNPTYTVGGGAMTWTAADTLSGVEYSVHGDANAGAFTNGIVVQAGVLQAGGAVRGATHAQLSERWPCVLDAAGANPRAYALVATGIGGNASVLASMSWREDR